MEHLNGGNAGQTRSEANGWDMDEDDNSLGEVEAATVPVLDHGDHAEGSAIAAHVVRAHDV